VRPVAQNDVTAMCARDVAGDAEAQAGAAGGAAARAFDAEEGFDCLFELHLVDARDLVQDAQRQLLIGVVDVYGGAAAVGKGVVDEVGQAASEQAADVGVVVVVSRRSGCGRCIPWSLSWRQLHRALALHRATEKYHDMSSKRRDTRRDKKGVRPTHQPYTNALQ
jgi:hypothetical protein